MWKLLIAQAFLGPAPKHTARLYGPPRHAPLEQPVKGQLFSARVVCCLAFVCVLLTARLKLNRDESPHRDDTAEDALLVELRRFEDLIQTHVEELVATDAATTCSPQK